jgi:5-methylcytosine-specific restriction enzyme B
MSHADRVREYARRQYIEPARARRQSTVRVVAGEVQKAVHLSNRVSLVCQALKSHKFLTENHLLLEKWEGPPSGMSTTVTFTYRMLDDLPQPSAQTEEWPFKKLRGVAREVFRSLGGGEAFLREEREKFHGSGDAS